MPSTLSRNSAPGATELERRLALSRAAQAIRRSEPDLTEDDRTTPEPVPPERLRLISAKIQHLSAIISQLVELRNEEECDQYGVLRATNHAFDVACDLLVDAAILSALEARSIPHGCASTDAEGGVRIEWIRPTTSVHLVVPASTDREGYVYHEVGEDYGSDPATPEALSRWLREIN